MTDKAHEVSHLLQHLNKLLETANNPKILWEEMQIVSGKAFDLQEQIMAILDEEEKTEKNIARLQAVFEARELTWDIVAKIAERELEIKEKTHTKKGKTDTPKTSKKTTKKAEK